MKQVWASLQLAFKFPEHWELTEEELSEAIETTLARLVLEDREVIIETTNGNLECVECYLDNIEFEDED